MAEVQRWVVVDDGGQVIGGPYLWDGVTRWTPPETGRLVLEHEAEVNRL